TSPLTEPQTRMSSPAMVPLISAPSPTVIERLCTSPSITPSIWMSPAQVRSPLIVRSRLMIEGDELRVAWRDGSAAAAAGVGVGVGVGAGGPDLLSFENIVASLQEVQGFRGSRGAPASRARSAGRPSRACRFVATDYLAGAFAHTILRGACRDPRKHP